MLEMVIGAIKSFDYTVERKVTKADGEEINVWSSKLQLRFLCEVAKHDIVVNPEEQSEDNQSEDNSSKGGRCSGVGGVNSSDVPVLKA